MPEWVRDGLAAVDRARADLAQYDPLLLIAEVNRAYYLGEPLRRTAQRRWWDILAWHLALVVELEVRAAARA